MIDRHRARIERIQRAAAASPRVTGLAGGLPAEAQFPKRAFADAFLRALRQAGTPALQYGWVEGSETLRSWIASRLRARGAEIAAADVIITSGAQQALAIALELVARPGARIGVDRETYPAALGLMRARRLVPVTFDDKAAVFYAMPAVGNPHGFAMEAESRRALLTRSSGMIVEDDAYADLRFDGPAPRPLLADEPRRVLHVGTFSKTLSPGLRVGWLIAPRRLRGRALEIKQSSDLQASSLAQAVLEEYLIGGGGDAPTAFDHRLIRLRRFYRARAAMMTRALREHLPDWKFRAPDGGFAIWAEAGDRSQRINEISFLEKAVAARVVFDPGSMFRASGAARPLAVRFCFSTAAPADFDGAFRRLARVCRGMI
jgi:2-aminoadipate transaminase